MRIGIDLDGCAYDFTEAWRVAHCLKNDLDLNEYNPEVGSEWSFFESDAWGNLSTEEFLATSSWGVDQGIIFQYGRPAPTFVEFMERANQTEGVSTHIVTARVFPGVEDQCKAATFAWLDKWNVPYDTLTFSTNKTSIPTDVFIDDRTENLDDIENAGTWSVRFVQPWNTPKGEAPDCGAVGRFADPWRLGQYAVADWFEFWQFVQTYTLG